MTDDPIADMQAENTRLLDALKAIGAEIAGIDWEDPQTAWKEHDEDVLVDTILTAWQQRDLLVSNQVRTAFRKSLDLAVFHGMANDPGEATDWLSFRHLEEMADKLDEAGSGFPVRKGASWLGWAQAAIVAATGVDPKAFADINREAFA